MSPNFAAVLEQVGQVIADLPQSDRDAIAKVRRELYAIAQLHGHAGSLAIMTLGLELIAEGT